MKTRRLWNCVLCFFIVACGSDADAPLADAAPDAFVPQEVTVYTRGFHSGDVVSGVDVLFFDETGAHVETFVSDSEGKAVSENADGGSVAINIGPNFLWSIGLVRNGDIVNGVVFEEAPMVSGNIEFTFPAFTGAAGYAVALPSNGSFTNGNSETVSIDFRDVGDGGDVQYVAWAIDSGGERIAYSSGTVAHPGDGSTVAETIGAWQTSFDEMTLTLNGGGTLMPEMNATVVRDGQPIFFGGFDVTSDPQMETISFAPGGWLLFASGTQPNGGEMIRVKGGQTVPATESLDLTGLAEVTNATFNDTNQQVTIATTETSGDIVTVLTEWDDGGTEYGWFASWPRGAGNTYSLPQLPGAYSAYQPPAGAGLQFVLLGQVGHTDNLADMAISITKAVIGESLAGIINNGGETDVTLSIME